MPRAALYIVENLVKFVAKVHHGVELCSGKAAAARQQRHHVAARGRGEISTREEAEAGPRALTAKTYRMSQALVR